MSITTAAFTAVLTLTQPSGDVLDPFRAAFADFEADASRDAGALWGVGLAGPILLVDPEHRDVFGNRADAEGRLIDIDGVHAGRVDDRFPMANSSHTWAGVEWATVMLPLPGDAFARRALLLHESFHRVQDELGLAMTNPDNGHLDGPDARTWFRAELRAWAAALGTRDEAWRDAARDAVAFRARRHALGPDVAGHEVALERHEGLAEYTGFRLADADAAVREAQAAAMLARFETRPSYVRSFAYATGPALGLLLDRVSDDWRAAVLAGAAPHALLAEALGGVIDHEPREATYDVAAIRADETARDAARRARREADLARLVTGPVLAVPLVEMQMTFDPNRVRPLDGHGTVYEQITLTDAWGRLEVRSSGALIAPTFDRAAVALPEEGAAWTLDLADGWRLERDAAGARLVGP